MEEAIPDEDIGSTSWPFGNAIASDPLKAQRSLLIGAAGAGKSTMIEAIANAEQPQRLCVTTSVKSPVTTAGTA